jgi:hypothetical protein
MSSWLHGVKLYAKPKKTMAYYYDVSNTKDIANTFLELLGAYIYSRKLNDTCNVYDPNGFITASIRSTPQLKVIKEVPEDTNTLSLQSIIQMTQTLQFSEIQKFASSLFEYTPEFNRGILQLLDKANIRSAFDIAIHLIGNTPQSYSYYLNILSEYQKKSKKTKLNVYVMSTNYQTVMDFQKVCDPSWKITSLSKFNASDVSSLVFHQLAEVQIFAVVQAAVLDFSNSLDRFIYMMQRNPKGYIFFKELSNTKWSIQDPIPLKATPVQPAPVQPAPVQPAPVEVAPVQSAPVEFTPVQAVTVEVAPVQRAPVQRAAGQRAPAQRGVGQRAPAQIDVTLESMV